MIFGWKEIAFAAALAAAVIGAGILVSKLINIGKREKELEDRRNVDRMALEQAKRRSQLERCDAPCLEEQLRKQIEEFQRR